MKRSEGAAYSVLLVTGFALLWIGHTTKMPLGGGIELAAIAVFAVIVWRTP
jgi:hypothetical protein